MNVLRDTSIALIVVGIAAGTVADRSRARPPLTIGGYRVLAADFHTHSSLWSDAALTPWGLVLEAERQGLDAIAITGHNQTLDGKIGRWFSRTIGGPLVLAGEEILSEPSYHLIAAGITERVSFQQSAARAIDEIHRQGGIAIAAHPLPPFWAAYDPAAMERLDGAEICHPLVWELESGQRDLERFAARGYVAAIGSSDFHGSARLGMCRTFVFAREASEAAVIDAVRAHRTVVYGRDGKAYGDPALLRLIGDDVRLREAASPEPPVSVLDWISRVAAVVGLAGVVALALRRAG